MPPLRGRCRGTNPSHLPVRLSHKISKIAHKELGVQFSKEGNIPTAMVTMERRDLHLKKSVDQLLTKLLVLTICVSDFSTVGTKSGLSTRWRPVR